MRLEGFLAYKDIKTSEHDLERIEEELKNCDAFLYIGGKEANESAFCQQEIGIAKALDKEIISVNTDGNPPLGFIQHRQAAPCDGIDNLYDIYHELYEFNKDIKEHLDILECEGFSFNKDKEQNKIYLEADLSWNDWHYSTRFEVFHKTKSLGTIKIARQGQTDKEHTVESIPPQFSCLPDNFFSRCLENLELKNDNCYASFCYLLNDVTVLSKEKLLQLKEEEKGIFELSIFRDGTKEFDSEAFENLIGKFK